MKIQFAKPGPSDSGAFVALVAEGKVLSATAAALDAQTGGTLSRAIAASRFEGKKDQALAVLAPPGVAIGRVLLLGLGKPAALDPLACQGLGGVIIAQLATTGETQATLALDEMAGLGMPISEIAANIGLGARLRAYRFDKYRTSRKPEEVPSLRKLVIQLDAAPAAKKAFRAPEAVAEGVYFTRDLVSEPANVLYPATLAAEAERLTELDVDVEVLTPKEMRKLGMGALLGVAQGSDHEARLVVMQWRGGRKDLAPVAFVGKGVTFDSGGISIKPADGMEDMKWDMGGAGAVIGAMKALAGRKARANVIGLAGLVENMPSGTAQRPGDVVRSMSGQTIEVINTDAEGRLVLADALWYVQERFAPQAVIDLATLTGAIIIALGHEYAGLFANNDDLAEKLLEAGKAVGEKLWRMPLAEPYDKQIKSEIADMKNTGGRPAGSATAAHFIQRFVKKDMPWAHLDIAGTAWGKEDKPVTPKGATGFGVRLLDRLVADYFEE